jgi:hypothetical protein
MSSGMILMRNKCYKGRAECSSCSHVHEGLDVVTST